MINLASFCVGVWCYHRFWDDCAKTQQQQSDVWNEWFSSFGLYFLKCLKCWFILGGGGRWVCVHYHIISEKQRSRVSEFLCLSLLYLTATLEKQGFILHALLKGVSVVVCRRIGEHYLTNNLPSGLRTGTSNPQDDCLGCFCRSLMLLIPYNVFLRLCLKE